MDGGGVAHADVAVADVLLSGLGLTGRSVGSGGRGWDGLVASVAVDEGVDGGGRLGAEAGEAFGREVEHQILAGFLGHKLYIENGG